MRYKRKALPADSNFYPQHTIFVKKHEQTI